MSLTNNTKKDEYPDTLKYITDRVVDIELFEYRGFKYEIYTIIYNEMDDDIISDFLHGSFNGGDTYWSNYWSYALLDKIHSDIVQNIQRYNHTTWVHEPDYYDAKKSTDSMKKRLIGITDFILDKLLEQLDTEVNIARDMVEKLREMDIS